MFWLLGMGVGSVAYALRGERVPGKFISIFDNDSDNGLPLAERALWIVSGIAEVGLGFMQLYAPYKLA